MDLSIDPPSLLRRRALQLEEISSTDRLEALEPEWSGLFARLPAATPFQSPAWLIPWWRHLGEGALCALALRDGERLRALAPLHVAAGPDGVRRLMLLGTGVSDVLDMLVEPGFESAAAQSLAQWLADTGGRWDEAELHQVPPDSPLLAVPAGALNSAVTPLEPCLALDLPTLLVDLARCVPAPMLKNLRYYERRARAAGPLEFEAVTTATLIAFLNDLLRLHGARWRAASQPGVLSQRGFQHFHREAVPALLAAGLLRGYTLRIAGLPVAVYYGFLHAGRAYDYLCGFDPRYARLSPGALLIHHAIIEAVREGAAQFDFLRGREDYKLRWGARERPYFRRRIWRI